MYSFICCRGGASVRLLFHPPKTKTNPETPNPPNPSPKHHNNSYIQPPHLILRKALIRGDALPTLADDLSEFMARNLFFTSSLHLTGPEKRAKVGGGWRID